MAEHGKHVMPLVDQHHGLLTICPPDIRRAIFRDFEDGDFRDYESLKQEILDRVEQELEEVQQKPGIHGLEEADPAKNEQAEKEKENQQSANEGDGGPWQEVNGVKGAKAKGKGKGDDGQKGGGNKTGGAKTGGGQKKEFDGNCFKCLQKGHRAFECPNPPHPDAKGKGIGGK